MEQLANDIEFIRSAALLIMGVVLTGLLVPVLKVILDNLNFQKQKRFEDQLARQNNIIEAQIQFLNRISELLWQFHALIARVSYYNTMNPQNDKNQERLDRALDEYEDELWDVLIVQIQSEVSKSRRLISPRTHQKLAALYKDVLVDCDRELVHLLGVDASREDWSKFHEEKLKGVLVSEIDQTLHKLANDMGLTMTTLSNRLLKHQARQM